MNNIVLIINFLITILIGLLIGYEREIHERKDGRSVISGVRTFTLVSIFGFIVSLFLDGNELIVLFMIGIVLFVFFSVPFLKEKTSKPGLTTSVALIIVFSCGFLAGLNHPFEAVLVVLLTLPILIYKKEIHKFASILSEKELYSALRFLSIIAIALPLAYTLGDINPIIGPGKVFDLVKGIIMIIFVSLISFLSYLIIRLTGMGKGLELTTFLGGFVSSSASTASISQKTKDNPSLLPTSLIGIMLTNTSMILKDMVVISFLTSSSLIKVLILPVILLITISSVFIYYYYRKKVREVDIDLELGSPFAVIPAAKFALLFSLISAAIYYLKMNLGVYGVYAVAVGGVVSTTSVSASLGTLFSAGEISQTLAISTFLLATGLGSLSKIAIAGFYDKKIARNASKPLIIIAFVSFLLFIFLNFIAK